MPDLKRASLTEIKSDFAAAMGTFVGSLREQVSGEDGSWTIKGFIDIYRNVYTISTDTKIISKILEIHLFPEVLKFAAKHNYSVVPAKHQNWYPDMSLVSNVDSRVKFAVDLKTTYRNPERPGHVNGFTLGSHGRYFQDRTSRKNIQFPYGDYLGHFCLGIIYSRARVQDTSETEIINVEELGSVDKVSSSNCEEGVRTVDQLRSIVSVISDFQFFFCEKWQLASDRRGSGNTANIGSITYIEDILNGNGVFAQLGEKWFDEYWMNYSRAVIHKGKKAEAITNLEDFLQFRGGDKSKIVPTRSKKKPA